MKKLTYFLFVCLLSIAGYAQSFNMTLNGSDTTTACNGTLYDNGGAAGNYADYSNDYFYINPSGGGSLSLTFTMLNTYHSSDRVYVYDGIGSSAILIGAYYYSNLPGNGNPLVMPSGKATIQFYSNSYGNSQGFAMNWTSSTSAPVASFSVNNPNPPLNVGVTFTNSSSNSGELLWDFGDGNFSTEANPVHAYSTPGTYQAKLINTNCLGTDTSSVQNIAVMASPVYSVTPDSLYASVTCGNTASQSFTISQSGGGTMFYSLTGRELGANPYIFEEGFENGLGQFTLSPSASSGFSPFAVTGGGAIGNGYLFASSYSGYFQGLHANIPASQPTEISYYLKFNNTTDRYGYMAFSDGNSSAANHLYYAYVYNSQLRVYTGTGSYYYPLNVAQWNFVELKNIDWTAHTYDLYINNTLAAAARSFVSPSCNQLTNAMIFNDGSYNFYYDAIRVKQLMVSNLNISPSNGVMSTGNSNTVAVSLPTQGLPAGQYSYEVRLKTNASGVDSLKVIPFIVDVIGTPTINNLSGCVDLDSNFVGYSSTDSVLIWNTGCADLNISSITNTHSEFTTSISSNTLPPGDSAYVHINFTPSTIGVLRDTLLIANNDTLRKICLVGKGLGIPNVGMDTSAINVTVVGCDDSVLVQRPIYNTGQGNLNYKVGTAGNMDLQDVLAAFSANYTSVTSHIPNMYQFYDGVTGYSISDGGGDMYDGGNVISTNLNTSPIYYSDNLVASNTISLGSQGQYFTYKGTGIWLFAADINGVNSFSINGNLGADGGGFADATVLNTTKNGVSYSGFVKRVYSAGDPSVNHLIIVENKPGLSHTYTTNTNDDQHTLTGLSSHTRIYYLLYAGSSGYYINNSSTLAIMNQFLNVIQGGGHASFVSVSPDSGVVAPTDTTMLSFWIKSTGLNSGTYQTPVLISTNDPADTNLIITVNLTVQGTPEVNYNTACTNMGSLMNGLSVTDTLPIWNTGCDSLLLTGTASISADITGAVITPAVAPGDTGWVAVTFSPTTIGAYSDTVSVLTNDSTALLCINGTGLGAPEATFSQDSIYVSFTSCNDSITIPLKVKNVNGSVGLNYEVEATTSGRKVLAYLPQYRSYEYSQVKSILLQDMDNILIEEYSSSLPTLQGHLDSVNLVLIPESYTYSSFWTSVSPILKTYINNGGTVILLYQSSSTYYSLDLIPGFSSLYSVSTAYAHNTSHPILQGVPSTVTYHSATHAVNFTGTADVLLSNSSTAAVSPSIVSVFNQGSGRVIQIGYDYNYHTQPTEAILKNAVAWGATSSLSDYITVSPDSGVVAVNDSVTINVTITSSGLSNGTYADELVIKTNDPDYPEVVIPVVVDVNGSADIIVDNSNCVSFTNILQGATATDSLMVTNVGCDTLDITGYTSGTSEFAVGGLPVSIAPGDSLPIFIEFTPLTVGSFSDTLILLNNDTAVSICVNGTSMGAPVLSASTDTMKVTLNKCNIIKNVSYNIANTGLGTLTYGLSIGDYIGTSQISYSTNQATTNHIFNGVPSSDTLIIRVILKGDYDDYYERAYLRIDNYNYSYVYDNNKPNHTLDTLEYVIYGNNVLNWTSDGMLDIELENSYDVDGSSGSFHRVEIFVPAQINWASIVGSATGSVSAGNNVNKSILFNAAALAVGTYNTNMTVTTNAPGSPEEIVPLQLKVVSAPEIALSDTCLYFPLTVVGDTAQRTMTVYNNGCSPLNIGSITSTNGAYKVSPTTGNIPVGDSLQLSVSFVPTQSNMYSASIIVNSNDSTEVICLNGLGAVLPIADFAINYENACLGEVAFVNTTTNSVTSYLWNMGDGSAYNTQNVTHYYQKPGTYTVKLTVTNSAGTDTISKTVTVNPLYVDFSMTNDTVLKGDVVNFYDSSVVATTWRWNFGDGTTSNVQNPSNTYNVLGKYTVKLEVDDANNCTRSTTKDLYVVDKIGLKENALEALKMSVYPNPSNTGKFTLESTQEDLTTYVLMVSDLNGKSIWKEIPGNAANTEVDLSGFSKGMYTISLVKDGRTVANKKLIVN